MANWLTKLFRKESATSRAIFYGSQQAQWSKREYSAFADEAYTKNVIAYQAIKKVSDALAAIPIELFRGDEQVTESPVLDLLEKPNPIQSGKQFLKAHAGFYMIAGNAYMEKVSALGSPRELYSLRPDRMTVIPGVNGFPAGFVYRVGQHKVAWDWEDGDCDVRHTKMFNPLDDWYGLSPIEPGAFAVDQHNETMRWIQALLQNGAMPSGGLEVQGNDSELTDEQFRRLKSEIEANYSGAKNAGRPMLLEGGMKWVQMGLSPDQMAAVDTKYSSARDVSLALGVPPLLLNIPGDSTYSNYREARLAMYEETVIPMAEMFIDELNNWLVPDFDDRLELRLNIDAIPAIAEKRQERWTMADGSNDLTINERREIKGYEPIEGGDEVMMPASMIPLSLAASDFGNPSELDEDTLKTISYGPSKRS